MKPLIAAFFAVIRARNHRNIDGTLETGSLYAVTPQSHTAA